MGKSKFKVGDKVRDKSETNSKIYTIASIRYDAADKRNVYTLKEYPSTYFLYSYQLEKAGTTETLERDNVAENVRAFKLTLEEAQEMYNAGGKLREFALRVFTEDELKPKYQKTTYPKTWDDYCDNFYPYEDAHYIPKFEHGFYGDDLDAFIAFGRLIRLHRAWVGVWKPNYYMNMASNWGIEYEPNPGAFCIENHCRTNGGVLTFPTKEMAEDFMNCFKDLLEKAKTLI